MAWTAKRELYDLASVTNTEQFSRAVKTNGHKLANVHVRCTFGGTTDDLVVKLYGSIHEKTQAVSATVAAGGVGYQVGDVLSLTGGMTENGTAKFRVTAIGGPGDVTAVTLDTAGDYAATPSNPVLTTGGSGSACTLNVTWNGDEWDTEPIEAATTLSTSTTPAQKSWVIKDRQRVRIGVASAGTTDTHAVAIYVTYYDPAN